MKQIIVSLLFISSCSNISYLNKQKHFYNLKPQKIIWLHIPGFKEEHLVFLKAKDFIVKGKNVMEKFSCLGQMWTYDHYRLRTGLKGTIIKYLTGSNGIKNKCTDFSYRPIWEYTNPFKNSSFILEGGYDPQYSVISYNKCPHDFFEEVTLWSQFKNNKKKNLYTLKDIKGLSGESYYVKCRKEDCMDSFNSTAKEIYLKKIHNKASYFYMIVDFSYFENLKKGNIKKALSKLREYLSLLEYFKEIISNNKDSLLIVTGGPSFQYKLPKSIVGWKNFPDNWKYRKYENSNLLTPLFTHGAGSENFCGLMKESDLFDRIYKLSVDPQKNYTINVR